MGKRGTAPNIVPFLEPSAMRMHVYIALVINVLLSRISIYPDVANQFQLPPNFVASIFKGLIFMYRINFQNLTVSALFSHLIKKT